MKQGTSIVWVNQNLFNGKVTFVSQGPTVTFDGEVFVSDPGLYLGDCDHDYVSHEKAANLMSQLKRMGFERVK